MNKKNRKKHLSSFQIIIFGFLFVILLGSIILNEILVLPCFGLDKHTEEKILEEKMIKDINNVDNTKLNDFSNDNAQL